MGAPADARALVSLKADLTADGSFPFHYIGMLVSVQEDETLYMLIGTDPTKEESWKKVGDNGVELTLAEYNALPAAQKMNGTVYFITDGKGGGGGGNAENVTLTQAEYDALSEEEKNSDTIYFITDAGGSDNVFYFRELGGDAYNMTFAELKAMYDAKRLGIYVGFAGNEFPFASFYYYGDATGDERLVFSTVSGNGTHTTCTVRPDDSVVVENSDTGWKTLTGDYFDIRYCKKNGVVYVTWNFVGMKQALAAKTPVTNCTLPEELRPKATAYTTVVENAAWNVGYVGIQGSGAMRFAYEQAISQGTGTMFGSLSYPA